MLFNVTLFRRSVKPKGLMCRISCAIDSVSKHTALQLVRLPGAYSNVNEGWVWFWRDAYTSIAWETSHSCAAVSSLWKREEMSSRLCCLYKYCCRRGMLNSENIKTHGQASFFWCWMSLLGSLAAWSSGSIIIIVWLFHLSFGF